MTEEIKDYSNLNDKNIIESDLQFTAGYKKFWTSKKTDCNWTNNSLHWHHCDKETMEKMSSTLRHIQKVLISIGNTLTDSIIHNDYEFQKLNTILNQQISGKIIDEKENNNRSQLREMLEELSQLGKKYNSYITQTIADEILTELKSYNTNPINLREKNTQAPSYARFLKDIVTCRRTIEEVDSISLNEECSAIFHPNMPPKLGDPGSFSISCNIGGVKIERAMCDLGASISLMP